MADEQTTAGQATGGDVAEAQTSTPSGGQAQEQSAPKAGSWLDRVLGRGSRTASDPKGESASQAKTDTEGESGEKAAVAPKAQDATDDGKITLSQEELDRRVQAEADRREAKRRADAARQQKRDLARNDPMKLAEVVEQEIAEEDQASQRVQTFAPVLQTALQSFDAAVLDPIVNAVPEVERKVLADKLPGGLDGRRAIVERSLKVLEKHWKAEGAKEAKASILKDPVARKQLLVELRGSSDEPDVVPAGNCSASSFDMNAMIRGARGGRRG